MSTIAAVSGSHTSGSALWNIHEHKKGELLGLKIDNQSIYNLKLELMDCFDSDAGKLGSTGATQAAEDLGDTAAASGKRRLQVTVPAGDFLSLGEEDLRGIEFLGAPKVIGSTVTSDCVVVAQYRMK